VITSAIILLLVFVVAIVAGAIASIAGFGIGSLLTPLIGLQTEMKLAVAAVSIPHFVGTAVRLWLLRKYIDSRVLRTFGLMSAAGGLLGALLHTLVQGLLLRAILGILLTFVGLAGLTGLASRMRFEGWMAWVAGALSGLLGGLVGNQGGIRAAAMFSFDVPKQAFVATATAVALMVDGARMPVYLIMQGREVVSIWPLIAAATLGIIVGTLAGERVLRKLSESTFRRLVSSIVLVLGICVLVGAGRQLLP
jgi:uncharacterized protein